MRKGLYISTVLFLIFIFSRHSTAWDNDITHRDLSGFAANNSVMSKTKGNYLLSLGFSEDLNQKFKWNNADKTAKEWLQDGAQLEDAGSTLQGIDGTARYGNHFHNPLKPWVEAGLDDWVILAHYTGESSLLWSQDSAKQFGWLGRDWSWQATRIFFYNALTKNSDAERQAYFAQTFRGLGHQMHLIQDASQPDHVRNDAHPLSRNQTGRLNIEPWAAGESGFINSLAATPQMPTLSLDPSGYSLDPSYHNLNLTPVALFVDTDQYHGTSPSTSLSQGLAEYTNANFASVHTIFAEEKQTDDIHYFPYPRKSSTDIQDYISQNKLPETKVAEDGVGDTGFWIKKTGDGAVIEHFVKPTYLTDFLQGTTLYNKTFYQDSECYKDYAKLLIPRAVGYSAGLLNYFFRGTLEISAPTTYIYSITDGSQAPYIDIATGKQHQQFTRIRAKVKNTTTNENIGAGSILAVARYKIIPDYASDLSNYPPDGTVMSALTYSYSISTTTAITSLSSTTSAEFTFDFTSSPIPAGITDLTLQVVFKGTLGNEADNAIAVGMKDLMEPTHIVLWNLTDRFSLYHQIDGVYEYHLHTAQEIKNNAEWRALVDLNHNGIYNETNEPYIDSYPSTYRIAFADSEPTAELNAVATAEVPAGGHMRLIALTDNQAVNYMQLMWQDIADPDGDWIDATFTSVLNQSDQNGIWQTTTPSDSFRYGLAADGVTHVPVIQHYITGLLGCYPMLEYPSGVPYCPYPESEAPEADLTSTPATINFQ